MSESPSYWRAQQMLLTASNCRLDAQTWPENSEERKQLDATADHWERRAKELELVEAPTKPMEAA